MIHRHLLIIKQYFFIDKAGGILPTTSFLMDKREESNEGEKRDFLCLFQEKNYQKVNGRPKEIPTTKPIVKYGSLSIFVNFTRDDRKIIITNN